MKAKCRFYAPGERAYYISFDIPEGIDSNLWDRYVWNTISRLPYFKESMDIEVEYIRKKARLYMQNNVLKVETEGTIE